MAAFKNFFSIIFILNCILIVSKCQEIEECQSIEDGNIIFWVTTTRDEKGEWNAEAGIESSVQSINSQMEIILKKQFFKSNDFKNFFVTGTVIAKSKNKKIIPKIPEGYFKFSNGKYYKFHNKEWPWSIAKKKCEEEKGFLAIPCSDKDKEVLENINEYSRGIWVGITDDEHEGVYKDVFGEKNQWWENMKFDFNDSDHQYNCGYIYLKRERKSHVSSRRCNAPAEFVCQVDIFGDE